MFPLATSLGTILEQTPPVLLPLLSAVSQQTDVKRQKAIGTVFNYSKVRSLFTIVSLEPVRVISLSNYCSASIDSCKGGLIHFFYDDKCTHLTGVSELENMANRCQVDALNQFDHPVYSTLQCTTTVKAAIPPSSYLIK